MRSEALADAESVEVAWDLVQTFLAASSLTPSDMCAA